MTLYIYLEITLDHTTLPENFFHSTKKQQMLEAVEQYYGAPSSRLRGSIKQNANKGVDYAG